MPLRRLGLSFDLQATSDVHLVSQLPCGHQNEVDANKPKLVKLSRTVANELVLLAAPMPLAISDLGAAYCPSIFATDASSFKGAICECFP